MRFRTSYVAAIGLGDSCWSYILRALAAGARAYLLKSATDEDLLPAIRAVAAGKPFFSPAVTAAVVEEYMGTLNTRGLTDSYHLLTDREKEVLQLLAAGRSNKDVATLLDVGLSTVETHHANLMQKLNLHNTAEIVLVRGSKRSHRVTGVCNRPAYDVGIGVSSTTLGGTT
jgi:DNA-binding NarL/FixJ family response regulator